MRSGGRRMGNISKLEALEILKEKMEQALNEKEVALTTNSHIYNFGREEAFKEAIEIFRRIYGEL